MSPKTFQEGASTSKVFCNLHVVEVNGLSSGGHRPPKTYVKIQAGDLSDRTKLSDRSYNPVWNEEFSRLVMYDSSETATVSFKVMCDGLISDTCIGSVAVPVQDLISSSTSADEIRLKLSHPKAKNDDISRGEIVLRLLTPSLGKTVEDDTSADEITLKNPPAPIESVPVTIGDLSDATTTKLAQLRQQRILTESTAAKALDSQITEDITIPLFKVNRALEVIVSAGDQLTQIHPYAKAAWQVLTAAYRVAKAQEVRDTKLFSLFDSMATMCEFVLDDNFKPYGMEEILLAMAQQCEECAKFIQRYTRVTSFSRRAAKHLWSSADEDITNLQDAFNSLHQRFQTKAAGSVLFEVLKLEVAIRNIHDNVLLKDLVDAGASWNSSRTCLSGTRSADIDDVTTWAYSNFTDPAKKVRIICGVAGSGKTSVANTLALNFHSAGVLAATFFFNRNHLQQSTSAHVISTIVRDLAAFDDDFRMSLCTTLDHAHNLAGTSDLSRQFEELWLKPASTFQSNPDRRIVIIIDALDECTSNRADLLVIFAKLLPSLPSNFRIILTGRNNADILEMGQAGFALHQLSVGISVTSDIEKFIKTQLSPLEQHLQTDWHGKTKLAVLVESSSGLFIWASTACKFILGSSGRQFWRESRLKQVLENANTLKGDIDELYRTALKDVDWDAPETPEFVPAYQKLVGTILLSKVPLSVAALAALQEEHPEMVQAVLGNFGALLRGFQSMDDPVTILHASFYDFITDPDRCDPTQLYFIDSKDHSKRIILTCLNRMATQFDDICCALKEPWATKINDSPHEVTVYSEDIRYATKYWIDHVLDYDGQDMDLVNKVYEFLSAHCLSWLEVTSFQKQSRTASQSLAQLLVWAKNCHHQDLIQLTYDLLRFTQVFSHEIEEHPTHIYSSMLPFVPSTSLMNKIYHRNIPLLIRGCPVKWPPLLHCLRGHTRNISSVGYSPDGKKVVCGGEDHSIRIYDVITGTEDVVLIGHTADVTQVAFHCNNSTIISASKDGTVRSWDTTTRAYTVLLQSPEGFMCIALSPDCSRVAIGDGGQTLSLRNTEDLSSRREFTSLMGNITSFATSYNNKKIVYGATRDFAVCVWDDGNTTITMEGHTDEVTAVSFSPNDLKIASGSKDNTVRMWNAMTGDPLRSFEGHTSMVASVAFSPKGSMVASGSFDTTVRVWGGEGDAAERVLEGHTDEVTSVTFSPDESKVFSGSWDLTAHIWNLAADLIWKKDHHEEITCLAFSQDGSRVITGSKDNLVFVWDAKAGVNICVLSGHQNAVVSVAFSADGTKGVSVDSDGVKLIWNIESGMRDETICTVEEATPTPGYLHVAPDFWITSKLTGKRLAKVAATMLSMRANGPEIKQASFGGRLAIGTERGRLILLDFNSFFNVDVGV